MAIYEKSLKGDFTTMLTKLHNGILNKSASASYENGTNYSKDGVRVAVRVYERFSVIGSNRVSMTVTLIGENDNLRVSIITSGGSQAMFMKLNTFGEESFLDTAVEIIEGR